MKRYRIVRDRYAGYEVQFRRWWWPFWKMAGVNTHISVELAEAYARKHAGTFVKYVDITPSKSGASE